MERDDDPKPAGAGRPAANAASSREADIAVNRAINEFRQQKERETQKNRRRGIWSWFSPASPSAGSHTEDHSNSITITTTLGPPSPPPTTTVASPPPPNAAPLPPPLSYSSGSARPPAASSREADIAVERAILEFEKQKRAGERTNPFLAFLRLFKRKSGAGRERANVKCQVGLPAASSDALPDLALHQMPRQRGPILSREAEIIVDRAIALFRQMREAQRQKTSRFARLRIIILLQRPLKVGLYFLLVVTVLLFIDGMSQERKELSARFAALEGKVTVQKRVEMKTIAATLDVPLINRDVDITSPTGQAVMVFPDGSAVHQEPSTQFEVRLLDYGRTGRRDRSFFLRYGAIFARISHRFGANGQTLITTPNAVAAARGTGFTVQHIRPRRLTYVGVAHGTVILRNAGGRLAVQAGQRAVAIGDNPPFLLTMPFAFFLRITAEYRRMGVFEMDPGYTLPPDLFRQAAGIGGNNRGGGAGGGGATPPVDISRALDAALASTGGRAVAFNAGIPARPLPGGQEQISQLSDLLGTGPGALAASNGAGRGINGAFPGGQRITRNSAGGGGPGGSGGNDGSNSGSRGGRSRNGRTGGTGRGGGGAGGMRTAGAGLAGSGGDPSRGNAGSAGTQGGSANGRADNNGNQNANPGGTGAAGRHDILDNGGVLDPGPGSSSPGSGNSQVNGSAPGGGRQNSGRRTGVGNGSAAAGGAGGPSGSSSSNAGGAAGGGKYGQGSGRAGGGKNGPGRGGSGTAGRGGGRNNASTGGGGTTSGGRVASGSSAQGNNGDGNPEEPIRIPDLPTVGGTSLISFLAAHAHETEKALLAFSSPVLERFGLTVQGWNFNATNAARRAACVQALHRIQEGIASHPGGELPAVVNTVSLVGSGLDAEATERVLASLGGSILESYTLDQENGYIVRARARDDQGTLYELTEAGVHIIPEARNEGKVRIEEQDNLTPGAQKLKDDLNKALKSRGSR